MRNRTVNIFLALLAAIALILLVGAHKATAAESRLRWPHKVGQFPYVVVEQHAPDFPVAQALSIWGAPFHYGYCNRHPSSPCIKVFQQRMGLNGYAALTPINGYGTTMTFAQVTLNTSYASRGSGCRLQTVLHELGHAVGLVHDNGPGVMRPVVDGHYLRPSAYERLELRKLYHLALTTK